MIELFEIGKLLRTGVVFRDHTYMTSAKRGREHDELKTILDVVEGGLRI